MAKDLTDDQIGLLREQLDAGRKLAAVKLYKEWTGASLAECKRAVERLQDFGSLPATPDSGIDEFRMDEILDAIERGNKLEAVKLHRQASGMSLKESKAFVERLMGELGLESRTGCATAILAALIVGVVVASRFA